MVACLKIDRFKKDKFEKMAPAAGLKCLWHELPNHAITALKQTGAHQHQFKYEKHSNRYLFLQIIITVVGRCIITHYLPGIRKLITISRLFYCFTSASNPTFLSVDNKPSVGSQCKQHKACLAE